MVPLKLSRLSATKDTGKVFRWLVAEGAKVTTGQPVVEIEMGRVTMEVTSPAEGIIHLVAKQFSTVSVGATLAEIRSEAEIAAANEPEPEPEPEEAEPEAPAEPQASPAARQLAEQLGVNLAEVRGSGPEGWILPEDVQKVAASRPETQPLAAITPMEDDSPAPAPAPEPEPPPPSAEEPEPPTPATAEPSEEPASVEASAPVAPEPEPEPEPPDPGDFKTYLAPAIRSRQPVSEEPAEPPPPPPPESAPPPPPPAPEPPPEPEPPHPPPAAEAPPPAPEPAPPPPPAPAPPPPAPAAPPAPPPEAAPAHEPQPAAAAPHEHPRHLSIGSELAADGLVDAHRAASKRFEGRTSVPDLLVLVVARALVDVSELNGTVSDDGSVERSGEVHLALTVPGADGVVSPVLRGAHELGLEQIASERARLTEAARAGQLGDDDFAGATATFWNLGSYPVDFFTPPERPAQIALVTTGRVAEKPVSFQRMLTIRPRMWVSLALDPRGADADIAGRFLSALQRRLTDLPENI